MNINRTLPEGAYINAYSFRNITIWEVFSLEGYCFYDITQAENYNEDSELLPENERVYMIYMKMRADEKKLKELIFVPTKPEYQIV